MSDKIIEGIKSGKFDRSKFLGIRANAERIFKNPKSESLRLEAEKVLRACNSYASEPLSWYYNFMGFCPGADITRRRDTMWREKGICDFHFDDSKAQMENFEEQVPGDWIILKKRKSLKEQTMELFGFGQITEKCIDDDGYTVFGMNWSDQMEVLLAPLMGCNATVNLRSLSDVEKAMPREFWGWLGRPPK